MRNPKCVHKRWDVSLKDNLNVGQRMKTSTCKWSTLKRYYLDLQVITTWKVLHYLIQAGRFFFFFSPHHSHRISNARTACYGRTDPPDLSEQQLRHVAPTQSKDLMWEFLPERRVTSCRIHESVFLWPLRHSMPTRFFFFFFSPSYLLYKYNEDERERFFQRDESFFLQWS